MEKNSEQQYLEQAELQKLTEQFNKKYMEVVDLIYTLMAKNPKLIRQGDFKSDLKYLSRAGVIGGDVGSTMERLYIADDSVNKPNYTKEQLKSNIQELEITQSKVQKSMDTNVNDKRLSLKIEHFNKEYTVNVNHTTIESALQAIFSQPNYFIFNQQDASVIAIGIDALKASVITKL
jgi:hypothetical protein